MFIIDNVADNFQLQIENGLNIKNFEGDENDVELQELAEDLKLIVTLGVEDVRDVLGKIREKMVMRYEVRYRENAAQLQTKGSFAGAQSLFPRTPGSRSRSEQDRRRYAYRKAGC